MPDETPITSEEMRRFNKLIDHAKAKGFAGRPELDHDEGLRKKIFDDFNKANPNDSIPIERVKSIQNEIQSYKQKALASIKAHPDSYKGKAEDFMKGISQVDGVFGQKTSQWKFPEAYLLDKQTGEKKKLGFANRVDMTSLNSAKSVDEFFKK